ncbi:antirestriction protein ArdA [Serratia nevei]|uniref:antirestriction protein ArdA n=1 Tax=Serratia nevei TaxID=2703794 RepID=UPI002551965C|nr:antirestriction protein ArdA [Serratia nevei]MDK5165542.1 antirestriction protein ArdA [Serratia nevei]
MMTIANNTESNNQDQSRGSSHPDLTQEASFTTTLYAQPYNGDAQGFYFHSFQEYEQKSENLRDRFGNVVEEFELQFIDGSDSELFEACRINQANLSVWFDEIELLDDNEKVALCFLLSDLGYNLEDAMEKIEDVSIQEGDLQSVAEELFDELYEVPQAIAPYIDYEKFARDCELNGDLRSFDFDGKNYVITNGNCL